MFFLYRLTLKLFKILLWIDRSKSYTGINADLSIFNRKVTKLFFQIPFLTPYFSQDLCEVSNLCKTSFVIITSNRTSLNAQSGAQFSGLQIIYIYIYIYRNTLPVCYDRIWKNSSNHAIAEVINKTLANINILPLKNLVVLFLFFF